MADLEMVERRAEKAQKLLRAATKGRREAEVFASLRTGLTTAIPPAPSTATKTTRHHCQCRAPVPQAHHLRRQPGRGRFADYHAWPTTSRWKSWPPGRAQVIPVLRKLEAEIAELAAEEEAGVPAGSGHHRVRPGPAHQGQLRPAGPHLPSSPAARTSAGLDHQEAPRPPRRG